MKENKISHGFIMLKFKNMISAAQHVLHVLIMLYMNMAQYVMQSITSSLTCLAQVDNNTCGKRFVALGFTIRPSCIYIYTFIDS